MKLTLNDAKAYSIAQAIGMQSCSEDFTKILNEAQQRLVMGPNLWWELTAKYRLCATSGRITWPRSVANPISITVDSLPYPVRNQWYEFLEGGYGERCTSQFCEDQAIDNGTAVTFDDIDTYGNDKTLKVYSTVTEVPDMVIGLFGYDQDGDWIRTQVGGQWVDGEWLAIPTDPLVPTQSSFFWSSLTEIIKPATAGDIKLYENDPIAATQRVIGLYECDETRPRYRRTLIGGIDGRDDSVTVTAIIKREFIPVRHGMDNDWLMIGNLPALKAMCMAVDKENKDNWEAAAILEAKARKIMDDEASHYLGPAHKIPVRVDCQSWAMADVPLIQ